MPPFPWKFKTGILLVFAIGYVGDVAVPACAAIQALVALLRCGAALVLRHHSTSPGPAARCSSVNLGA